MNKKEFIEKLAAKTELAKKDIKLIVDTMPEVVKESVESERKLSLTGFIAFEKKNVAAKTGTIQIGENKGSQWTTPAHSEIKVRLNKSYRML